MARFNSLRVSYDTGKVGKSLITTEPVLGSYGKYRKIYKQIRFGVWSGLQVHFTDNQTNWKDQKFRRIEYSPSRRTRNVTSNFPINREVFIFRTFGWVEMSSMVLIHRLMSQSSPCVFAVALQGRFSPSPQKTPPRVIFLVLTNSKSLNLF